MEAQLITDRAAWNRFVAATPSGHLCQTYEWAEHGEDATARAGALHVGVVDGGALVGAMLLLRSAARGLPWPLFYAPRGPVVADPDGPALPVLLAGAARLARQAGGFALRVEPNVPDGDERWLRALARSGFHPTPHTIYLRNAWVTDIRPSEDDILANMMMTWRQNVRAAARKGVTVRVGASEADFEAFYRLLGETATRDHFYLYPRHVFRDMLAHYSAEAAARDHTAEMALLLAEFQGEPIAASTVAAFGGWAWNLHSGSSAVPEHRKPRPNYLLQFECMRWAKAHGCDFYDFRTIPDVLEPGQELWGVYEFKRGFGGAVRRVIPTLDRPLNPMIYYPYQTAVAWRRRRHERQRVARETPAPPPVADATTA